MITVYISGPISGQPRDEVSDKFNRVAQVVTRAGGRPINPTDIAGWGLPWATYMQIAFNVLASGSVDRVYMLKGWRESHGACLERYYARRFGIPIMYQDPDDYIKSKLEEAK